MFLKLICFTLFVSFSAQAEENTKKNELIGKKTTIYGSEIVEAPSFSIAFSPLNILLGKLSLDISLNVSAKARLGFEGGIGIPLETSHIKTKDNYSTAVYVAYHAKGFETSSPYGKVAFGYMSENLTLDFDAFQLAQDKVGIIATPVVGYRWKGQTFYLDIGTGFEIFHGKGSVQWNKEKAATIDGTNAGLIGEFKIGCTF